MKPEKAAIAPGSAAPFALWMDRLMVVLLVLTIAACAIHKIVAYDIWWQLKTGEWILSNGFPSTDPFSYAAPDRPWIEVRWLFCVAANLLFQAAGPNGLILGKLAMLFAAFAAVWAIEPKAPIWTRILGIGCTLAIAHLRFTIRPELVTFLLLPVTLLALHRYKQGGRAWWIYVLPAVQVVWTNSHTLFVLGPVTVWIYAVAEYAAQWSPIPSLKRAAMARDRLRPLLLTAAGCTAACLVNPYFIQGALFPFQLFSQLQAGNVIAELITELHSPFAYAGWSFYFLRYPVVVAIALAGFAANWRRVSPGLLAVFGAYLYLSTLSERNLALLGFVTAYAVIVNYSNYSRFATEDASARVESRMGWVVRTACLLAALMAIPALATDYYYAKIDPSRRFGFGIAENRFPLKAMAFLDREGTPGPILGNLVDSNYVLFDRGPKNSYVDGRLEVYGGTIVKQADDLFKTGKGLDEALERFQIQTALVAHKTDGNLFRILNRREDWAAVYFDEIHVVFMKNTPETHARVEVLRVDWKAPSCESAGVPANVAATDWLAGYWPRVADNVESKALGQLALLTGNLELARTHFEMAASLRPGDSDVALSLGVVLRAMGEDGRAAVLLDQAGGYASRISTPLAAARAFEGAGGFEAAAATYQGMIARGQANAEVYKRLADAMYNSNDRRAAADALRRAIALDPDDDTSKRRLRALEGG